MQLRRLAVAAAVVVLLGWLALRPRPMPEHGGVVHRDALALGTLVTLTAWIGDAEDAAAQAAFDDAVSRLDAFHAAWHPAGDGILGQVNADLAAGRTVALHDGVLDLFRLAEDWRAHSAGRFDARVGSLVRLWGFDDDARFRDAPPGDDAIAAARDALSAAGGLDDAGWIRPAAGVAWDFGGLAKGVIVDDLAGRFRDAGLPDVLINAGGNLRAIGNRGTRAWRIGIRHPRPSPDRAPLAVLESDGDDAIVTSGDYERYFEDGGTRYHHLLDPRTGRPARGLQAVSVVADQAAAADAAATALFVAGPDGWRALARKLELDQVLVVHEDGRVDVTAALEARLTFDPSIRATVVP